MRTQILSVASYLPPNVRKNDWWPEDVVDSWRDRSAIKRLSAEEQSWFKTLTRGQQRVIEAAERAATDPFRGAIERRVMPDDMLSSEMEAAAAREAIQKANIAEDEIDLVVVQSIAPDFLHVANACAVHRQLDLKPSCISLSVEMVCTSFMHQLTIADAYIRSGRCRYVLVVQSSAMSRFADWSNPGSAWFGDGAGAAVLGVGTDDDGLLGLAHATHSEQFGLVVTGIPGKRWYEGRPSVYVSDREALRTISMNLADEALEVIDRALGEARVDRSEVKFFACHQAMPWLPQVVLEHAGLTNARSLETFKHTASLLGANIPHILTVAANESLVRAGDLVVLFAGGAGTTVCASVVRWSIRNQ